MPFLSKKRPRDGIMWMHAAIVVQTTQVQDLASRVYDMEKKHLRLLACPERLGCLGNIDYTKQGLLGFLTSQPTLSRQVLKGAVDTNSSCMCKISIVLLLLVLYLSSPCQVKAEFQANITHNAQYAIGMQIVERLYWPKDL